MKKQVVKIICDMCGCDIDLKEWGKGWSIGYHVVDDGEYAEVIGIRAMFSNGGDGSKYDLCKKCTLKIAKQFVKKMENEEESESGGNE